MSLFPPFPAALTAPRHIITPFLPPRVFLPYLPSARMARTHQATVTVSNGLAVVRAGIGAAAVEAAVVYLAPAGGSGVVFVGSCGGLGASYVGEVLVVSAAVAGAPASRLCAAPDRELHALLCGCLPGVRQGVLFSAAAVQSDPSEILAAHAAAGAAGVDMETFAFFRAAAAAGLPAAAVVYVTDTPGENPCTERHTPADRQRIVDGRDRAVQAAVRCARMP
jgi:uridine phosphorylase